jgi:hypothetical protein
MPDVMQVVKQEATPYLGDVSNMSDDQIKSKIKNLAKTRPDTAREMVDSVCSALDRTTGGQYHNQIDRLEQMVVSKLGLDVSSLPPASSQQGSQQARRVGSAGSASREPSSASREPGSVSREPGGASRESGAASRAQGGASREPGAARPGASQSGGAQAGSPRAGNPRAGGRQMRNSQPGKPENPQAGGSRKGNR